MGQQGRPCPTLDCRELRPGLALSGFHDRPGRCSPGCTGCPSQEGMIWLAGNIELVMLSYMHVQRAISFVISKGATCDSDQNFRRGLGGA